MAVFSNGVIAGMLLFCFVEDGFSIQGCHMIRHGQPTCNQLYYPKMLVAVEKFRLRTSPFINARQLSVMTCFRDELTEFAEEKS